MLAEARSLRLSLTIANQHLGQLTRDLREGIASNARSRVVFQCGQDDAAYLAHEMAPLDAAALMSLERFEAAARLSIGGHSSEPFTIRTLPAVGAANAHRALESASASAERYARPVELIDQELKVAVGSSPVEAGDARRRREEGPAELTVPSRGLPAAFRSGNGKNRASHQKTAESDRD